MSTENTALILLNRQDLSATFTQSALALKDEALESSALVGRVDTAADNQVAADAQLKLATLRRTITKAHKEAKEMPLRACQQIDAIKNEFLEEILAEELRITKLTGDFHALQDAKRKAAEEVARLEAEKIENARRAEEQRIHREALEREAIEQRKREALESKQRAEAAESQRKIQQAKNAEQRAIAEADAAKRREQAERDAIELRRQQELAAANTHAQLDAAQERASNAQQAVVVPTMAPVAAAGQTVKKDIEITIVDVHLLCRVHPGLVNIEPRLSDIKVAILSGAKIAGVSHKEIFKSQVRSSSGPKAIDV